MRASLILIAAATAVCASGAAEASTSIGYTYFTLWSTPSGGDRFYGDSSSGDPPAVMGDWKGPPTIDPDGILYPREPGVAANASAAGTGLASVAIGVTSAIEKDGGLVAGQAQGYAWVNYTFKVTSPVINSGVVFLDIATTSSVQTAEAGAVGTLLRYSEGDTQPSDLQVFSPSLEAASGLSGVVSHDGHVFEYENDQSGYHVTDHPTDMLTDTQHALVRIEIGQDYTFTIAAWALEFPKQGGWQGSPFATSADPNVLSRYYANANDYPGSSDAPAFGSAWIDPIFTINGGDPGDFQFVGLPDAVNGDLGNGAGAVPETATWAMLVLGFAGLAHAGARRPRIRSDA